MTISTRVITHVDRYRAGFIRDYFIRKGMNVATNHAMTIRYPSPFFLIVKTYTDGSISISSTDTIPPSRFRLWHARTLVEVMSRELREAIRTERVHPIARHT